MSNEQTRKGQLTKGRILQFVAENSITFILLGIFLLSSVFVPRFLTSTNIINILRQISALAIISMGIYFAIVTGGFDLSVGSTIGFAGVLLAHLAGRMEVNIWLSVLVVILAAMTVGVANGVFVVYGGIAPFIATLGTMIIVKGINFLISLGIPISGYPRDFSLFGRGYLGVIPIPVVAMLFVAILCHVFMHQTIKGREFYAVGGNEEAAKLSGVKVNQIKIMAYALSSLLAAIGGIMISSRIMAGQPTVGDNMLFDVITAAVLGGTALTGGKGRIVGVVSAAVIIGIIANVMVLLRIDPYWQWIIKGAILILAVFIDAQTARS